MPVICSTVRTSSEGPPTLMAVLNLSLCEGWELPLLSVYAGMVTRVSRGNDTFVVVPSPSRWVRITVSLRWPARSPYSPGAELSVPTSSQFCEPCGALAGRWLPRFRWIRAIEPLNQLSTT